MVNAMALSYSTREGERRKRPGILQRALMLISWTKGVVKNYGRGGDGLK